MDVDRDAHAEDNSSRKAVVILFLILLASPGSLMLFAMPFENTTVLLLIVLPVTVLFVLWYKNTLSRRGMPPKEPPLN